MIVPLLCLVAFIVVPTAFAADPGQRFTFSAGMGVSYINPTDIIDLVNASSTTNERHPDFTSTVVFFGAVHIPLTTDWALKIGYGYQLGSFTVNGFFGNTEYTMVAHLPSVLLEYALALEPAYTVYAGLGGGYHFGTLTITSPLESMYSGRGPAMVLDLEANTAFGDNLFGYIGVDVQWEFIGELTDAHGNSPGPAGTSMNYFGPGVKFGLSYHL